MGVPPTQLIEVQGLGATEIHTGDRGTRAKSIDTAQLNEFEGPVLTPLAQWGTPRTVD